MEGSIARMENGDDHHDRKTINSNGEKYSLAVSWEEEEGGVFLKSGIERSLRGVDSRLFLELRMTRNKGEEGAYTFSCSRRMREIGFLDTGRIKLDF